MRRLIVIIGVLYSAQGAEPINLIGTVINTTTPNRPLAASMQMVFTPNGPCSVTISPPLIGSGSCVVTSYDLKSGHMAFSSTGIINIEWTGTAKGNLISGSYRINSSNESGSFYLTLTAQDQPKPKPAMRTVPRTGGTCSPAIESSIAGDFKGWEGETIFKLDNGQIWQQAEYDYMYSYSYNPDVTIYETTSGCRMKVEDEDETILVKRLK